MQIPWSRVEPRARLITHQSWASRHPASLSSLFGAWKTMVVAAVARRSRLNTFECLPVQLPIGETSSTCPIQLIAIGPGV